jgi:hypothetical protein
MSLHALATNMASKGRNGDSMLVHMTPGEVHGLQALAMKHGGSLTVNPDTGLPEANFLKSLLPMIAGFALAPLTAGTSLAFLGASPMAAAMTVGGITGLATGSLKKGLMAGLGAYGGAGLQAGLAEAGASTIGATEAAKGVTMTPELAADLNIGGAGEGVKDRLLQQQVTDKMAAATPYDKLSSGLDAFKNNPMGMTKSLAMPLAAAASPIMADMMVPTTTKAATPMAPGRIREKRWNGQYFEDVASTDAGVYNESGRNFSDLYRGYNGGGIVALANGGVPGYAGDTGSVVNYVPGQFDQATINAALATELGNNKGASLEGLRSVARDTYKLTDAEINAAFDTIPGFNAQGKYDAADYMATHKVGVPDYQMTVDAANAANPFSAQNMAKVDVTRPGQYVNDASGNPVALSYYSPGFDINNPTALTYLGELSSRGGGDTASQWFQQNATAEQKAKAADLWAKEKARLDALDATKGLSGLNQKITDTSLTNQNQNKDQNVNAGLTALDDGKSKTYKWFEERGLGFTPIDKVIDNWFDQYTDDLALKTARDQVKIMEDALDVSGMNEADLVKATGKTISQWIQQKKEERKDGTKIIAGDLKDVPADSLPGGVSGGSKTFVNDNGTITTSPDLTLPMRDVRDAYTKGGGSLGYTSPSFDKIEDFNKKYVDDRMSGDSLAAYEFLSGKKGAKYPTKSGVGRIAEPYDEAVLGYPARGNLPFIYDKDTGKMVRNMDYVAPGRDAAGNVNYTMSLNEIKKLLTDAPLSGQALYDWAQTNKVSAQQIADATGRSLSSVYADFRKGAQAKTATDKKAADDAAAVAASGSENDKRESGGAAAGGLQQAYAMGGATGYALGGLGTLGGYSDGGRLLKGPGDGVSDSIPATIGRKQQPARLADGEFVVPARIVSELGNGSTDAGAKKLYAMLDRVQRARGKTTGKNKVAANSRADKYLPA